MAHASFRSSGGTQPGLPAPAAAGNPSPSVGLVRMRDYASAGAALELTTRERIELLIQRIEQCRPQRSSVPSVTATYVYTPPASEKYGRALRAGKRIIFFMSLAGAFFGSISVLVRKPLYEARTLIAAVDSPLSDTEVIRAEILESSSLRERVLRRVMEGRPDWGGVVEQTAARLSATPRRDGHLLEISCRSTDARLAALYVNAVTAELIAENSDLRAHAAPIPPKPIPQEQREHSPSSGAAVRKLRELQEEALTAQVEVITRGAQDELARQVPVNTLPEILDDASIRADKRSVTELRRQLAEAKASFTPQYALVRSLEAQITTMESDIDSISSQIVNRLHNEARVARDREKMLARSIDAQNTLVAEEVRQEARSAAALREQESMSASLPAADTQVSGPVRTAFKVIDAAVPPQAASRGDIVRAPVTGMFAGLFGSVALVLIPVAGGARSRRRLLPNRQGFRD